MKINHKLNKNSNKSTFIIALFLLALTIFIRLPFFFRDVINWDEGTYILIGQSFLDGYDTERSHWSFRGYPYSLFILIFGQSIIGIRFAGALCVTLVSFFLYLIGKRFWNQVTGILAGIFFILLGSLWPSGQATMSQHIALVPLIGALLLSTINTNTPRILFLTAALTTLASMIRLNLAYVTLFIGIYLVLESSRKSFLNLVKSSVIYTSGFLIVLLLCLLPYASAGQIKLWWTLNISFALSYSGSQKSILTAFSTHLKFIFDSFKNRELFAISPVIWLGGLAGFVMELSRWKKTSTEKRRALIVLSIFVVSTSLSIVKGGAAYPHYLIQLIPFFSLYAAIFCNFLLSSRAKWLTIIAIFVVLLISLKPIIGNYKWRISRFIEDREINYGPAYEVAEYLQQYNNLDNDIYIMDETHIAYLLIDARPISKTTVHPSNMGKEYLLESFVGEKTTTKQELAKILDQHPKFIVTRENIWYLQRKQDAKLLLQNTLKNKYELVKQVQQTQIYRRKK